MKTKIIAASLSLSAFISCYDVNESFENKLYFDVDSMQREVRVATDEKVEEMTVDFAVAMAKPSDRDIELSFRESPELLETYRIAYYDPDAELLPEGHCDISSLQAVIKAGNVTSGDIALDFVGLGEGQGLDYEKRYVLPVTLCADGIEILERYRTMYFVVREAALVNVAADMTSNCAWPEWGDFEAVKDMKTFTFECLVNGQAFKNKSSVHTLMGIEDNFLLRFGDTGLPGNQLQVAYAIYNEEDKRFRNNVTSSVLQIKPDRWYHIAVTFDGSAESNEGADIKIYYDGKLKMSEKCLAKEGNSTMPINSRNFMVAHSDEQDGKPRCFWIGYSYDKDRPFNGLIAEVRVWNKALTEEELNAPAHFYKLYRDNDGKYPESLIAYWKFDGGNGKELKEVKDHSASGRNLKGNSNFLWRPVELPVK